MPHYKELHSNSFVRKFRKWKMIFTVILKILKSTHFIVIYLKREDMVSLIKDDNLESSASINYSYIGMAEHQAARAIKEVGDKLSDEEIICSKAEYDVYMAEKLNFEL